MSLQKDGLHRKLADLLDTHNDRLVLHVEDPKFQAGKDILCFSLV